MPRERVSIGHGCDLRLGEERKDRESAFGQREADKTYVDPPVDEKVDLVGDGREDDVDAQVRDALTELADDRGGVHAGHEADREPGRFTPGEPGSPF